MTDYDICWYCGGGEGQGRNDWAFSIEFDTWVHLSCLRKRLAEEPDDEEALIMAEELLPEHQLTCDKCLMRAFGSLMCTKVNGIRLCHWPIGTVEGLLQDAEYVLSIRKYGGKKK